MADAVVTYDRDLPEIPGRRSWGRPGSYLVKDDAAPTGWREDTTGRRPTELLLTPKIRAAVDAWRAAGYVGAPRSPGACSPTGSTKIMRSPGSTCRSGTTSANGKRSRPWRGWWRFVDQRDAKALVEAYGTIYDKDLFAKNISFQTTMDGRRQLRRYVPELDADGIQDLPPENLRRFCFKLATGSGKTWVMAMAVVWSHFHKRCVPGSELSTNFLIVAPNMVVYQRLEEDFANNRIFHELPLIPPEWKSGFAQKVILRGEATEPDPSGNLFLTNIHHLYPSRDQEWTPANAVDALLGRRPAQDRAAAGQPSMRERVRSLPDLVVLNDEAHHVHDDDLTWNQSLLDIHETLPNGIAAWLDFSATPKDQNGMYFPWTVVDYPLAQAVEDRIVKAPIIVTNQADREQPEADPERVTRANVAEKYGYWVRAAVQRWREHRKAYRRLGIKPVLFIMAEKNAYADALGEHLWRTAEFGFRKSEVLVIHTDSKGEITKKDLDAARQAARDIDRAGSRIKAIVSVMMLREGWDVRGVTVVLGLRPFTSKAKILPEQVIGRGLRLMPQVSPDRTQTLEVLGTRNLLAVLREQLEAEGVGIVSPTKPPVLPVVIEPVQERIEYDIAVPLTKPSLTHDVRKLSDLDVSSLGAIFDQDELEERFRIPLKLEFVTTETEVHQAVVAAPSPPTRESLARITNKVIERARLPNRFADLYPVVREYVTSRCFGMRVDTDDEAFRSHLARPELQDGIAGYLARVIGALTVEYRVLEFDKADFRLSQTKPFSWRRDLPPLVAHKTVFNYVATYNSFERSFAEFLDRAADVARFAALGTTEQGNSASAFRVDYLKPNGAIGFYYPDWVAVQQSAAGEVNWIIETKGRVWEGTEQKDAAMQEWCRRVERQSGIRWQYRRINQSEFDHRCNTLDELIARTSGVF